MCGIAGYCLKSSERLNPQLVNRLMNGIRKRGPDDEGVCLIDRPSNAKAYYAADQTVQSLRPKMPSIYGKDAGINHDVALMHSRYAILDLSDNGHQPFVSQQGDVTVIFNGEIYNYIELRNELIADGVVFKTQCDTEVLAEGYSRWKDDLWPRLNGFWAVVIYDRKDKVLVFSRDRLGVAPLYYRETDQGLFFCSYIQPLLFLYGNQAKINDDALRGFIQTGYKDVNQETFYKDINTFPAASFARLSVGNPLLSKAKVKKFWHLPQGQLTTEDLSFEQAVKKFREIFFNAVTIRLRADVKIAFELSGGLDSSSIVAACAQISKEKITTYTAKVRGADEEPIARTMCRRYPLDYRVIHEKELTLYKEGEAFADLMEEPYDNPNAYTHHQMLKEMKAQGVKVVITGAGGDEALAGYESSFWPSAYRQWRSQGGKAMWDADCYEFCRRYRTWKNAKSTLRNYMTAPWRRLFPSQVTDSVVKERSTAFQLAQKYKGLSYDEQRQFHVTTALLPYYMRSSDHFTMGIPIEHRFPLLDYRLIEFGLQMPIEYLFHNGWTKYLLRKAMEPFLPKEITWRREKMGFRFPYQLYFAQAHQELKPVLQKFYSSWPEYVCLGSYEILLKQDPLLLWRLISTAVWLNSSVQKGEL